MKAALAGLVLVAAIGLASPASAEDLRQFSIAEAVASPAAKQKLDPSIRLYFRTDRAPAIAERLGSVSFTRKTNRASTADSGPCPWSFLSGLLALQARARERGANAVIDIVSLHDRRETAAAGRYECEYGMWMVSTEVKGEMVRLAGR